ncbi:MAG: UMP kinase [Candidatus Niyogibacteria bacterium]|nr:MAG: UMP kinase [Candidatus Niyogibacteria bacterium]
MHDEEGEPLGELTRSIYTRAILKISGETLSGEGANGINASHVSFVAHEIKEAYELGVELAIVMGGGNLVRGEELAKTGIVRETADKMGMLLTVANALCLQDGLEKLGLPVRVAIAQQMPDFGEYYVSQKVRHHLRKREIVILAAGTGNPFVSTDTAAVLRACELRADVILKATKVEGVYSKDPQEQGAEFLRTLTSEQMLQWGLKIMDSTAASMVKDNRIPIVVFRIFDKGNLRKVLLGDPSVGSRVDYQSQI